VTDRRRPVYSRICSGYTNWNGTSRSQPASAIRTRGGLTRLHVCPVASSYSQRHSTGGNSKKGSLPAFEPARELLRSALRSGSFTPLHRAAGTNELPRSAETSPSRRFVFSAFAASTCATSAAGPALSVSRESHRGPKGTLTVPLGPRKSPAQTLRVSG
jgi:hypothetical protein